MKYLKKYENWFTNIFKTGEDTHQDWQSNYGGAQLGTGYNALMDAALEGNWKRFKNLLPEYIAIILILTHLRCQYSNLNII